MGAIVVGLITVHLLNVKFERAIKLGAVTGTQVM